VEGILNLVGPLVQDQSDQPETEDEEDFAEEQGYMGRFIQLFLGSTPDQQYLVRRFSNDGHFLRCNGFHSFIHSSIHFLGAP